MAEAEDAADEIVTHEFTTSTRVVEAWWYRTEKPPRLVIRFPDQHRQQYLGVDADLWDGFINADSPGRYLREYLDILPNSPL